ncbi:hypothetical protein ColTof4_01101 [Colletotrichum tofieldiae]|nr:hypothetical protein ColTof3_08323 [Colletotrichum tofieldiae]GKT68678.1 hypothetical protein ColTof4_01101 [Colletotrichum tofieldiae]GKT96715.1 hypothetical protein Ct61P_14565 [Colletotrichum tofieldiae]
MTKASIALVAGHIFLLSVGHIAALMGRSFATHCSSVLGNFSTGVITGVDGFVGVKVAGTVVASIVVRRPLTGQQAINCMGSNVVAAWVPGCICVQWHSGRGQERRRGLIELDVLLKAFEMERWPSDIVA